MHTRTTRTLVAKNPAPDGEPSLNIDRSREAIDVQQSAPDHRHYKPRAIQPLSPAQSIRPGSNPASTSTTEARSLFRRIRVCASWRTAPHSRTTLSTRRDILQRRHNSNFILEGATIDINKSSGVAVGVDTGHFNANIQLRNVVVLNSLQLWSCSRRIRHQRDAPRERQPYPR